MVLWRAHALGTAQHDPAEVARTVSGVAADLPAPFSSRLALEWPAPSRLEGGAGLEARDNAVRAGGFTLEREWTGPTPLSDRTRADVRVAAAAAPADWLAATVVAGAGSEGVRLEHATMDLGVGRVGFWGGRRRVGYAPGGGGGLVIHRAERFDGAGVRLARPWRVPLLGVLSGEVVAGPVAGNGHVEEPWLVVTRAHARPHARFDLGITRAALFGGLAGATLGPRQLAEVLIGANLGGRFADDQIASADARWRPPVAVPMELYGEWAMHDIDFGVLFDMPTYTIGLRFPRLAVLGGSGIELEHTRISGSCCDNPPWYHHFELADGWVVDGNSLGHPLGGHGEQWRLGIGGGTGGAALIHDAAAILRWRGAENVFAPDRHGRSARLEVATDAGFDARASAGLRLAVERGTDWTELEARLVARFRF